MNFFSMILQFSGIDFLFKHSNAEVELFQAKYRSMSLLLIIIMLMD